MIVLPCFTQLYPTVPWKRYPIVFLNLPNDMSSPFFKSEAFTHSYALSLDEYAHHLIFLLCRKLQVVSEE
jgi:hypothetical protein